MIYEVYKLSIQTDGREIADLTVSLLEKDLVVDVNNKIAREAAVTLNSTTSEWLMP